MLKRLFAPNFRTWVIGLVVLASATGIRAQNSNEFSLNVSPLPSPTAPVNDFAGVVDDSVEAEINRKLIDFQRSSGVELAVAVIRTTGDRPISDYSLAVYRGWGIGSKGDDNPGALLLIAVDDRKYFTQVGRDLEDELPDSIVGNLQRQYLVPELRNGNYGKAVSDTMDAYIRTYQERSSGTAASPTPVPGREQPASQTGYSAFCCLVIIGIIILLILANRGGRSGRRGGWGGGGFGGGGSALPWIIGSVISNAASSSSWGSSSDSGSSWGGGDWGGGGSDWGGFGGGGDAGGGGAGGGW